MQTTKHETKILMIECQPFTILKTTNKKMNEQTNKQRYSSTLKFKN